MRLIDADQLHEAKFPEVFNNFQEGWNEAIDATIECAPTVDFPFTGWIPVALGFLPEEEGSYLVCTRTGAVTTARFYTEKTYPPTHYRPTEYKRCAHWSNNRHVVYWMPLPKAPGLGGDDDA